MVDLLCDSPLASVARWGAAEVRAWLEKQGVPRGHSVFEEVGDGPTLLMLVGAGEGWQETKGAAGGADAAPADSTSLLGEYLSDLPGGGRFLARQIEIELRALCRLARLKAGLRGAGEVG